MGSRLRVPHLDSTERPVAVNYFRFFQLSFPYLPATFPVSLVLAPTCMMGFSPALT